MISQVFVIKKVPINFGTILNGSGDIGVI